MEHACAKCGTAVEDGVPFCPNCNAPQIRVSGLANRPATPPFMPGTPEEMNPAAEPVLPGRLPARRALVQWSQAVPGAAAAGFLLALSLRVPLALPVLLMMSAGGFAVALYARRSPAPLSGGVGARVGAVGGLLGFVVTALFLAVEVAASGGNLVRMLRQALAEQLARNPDPRAAELVDKLTTPAGLAVVVAFGLIMFLAIVVVCAALGGAIAGAAIARRDKNVH